MVGSAVEMVVRSSAERKEATHSAEKTRKKCTRAVSLLFVLRSVSDSMLARWLVVEAMAGSRRVVEVCSENEAY